MRLHFSVQHAKSLLAGAFAAFALLGLSACSGSADEDEKLKPEGEEAEAQGSEAAANEATAAAEPTPTPEPAPAAAPAPAPTPAPAATAGGTSVEKNRVIRYVSSAEVAIVSQPKDGGETVGKLVKGDKVMVVEENGWGRITNSMYVKLNQLSNKAVARERQPAVWQEPTH